MRAGAAEIGKAARAALLCVDVMLAELALVQPVPPHLGQVRLLVDDAMGSPADLHARYVHTAAGVQALVFAMDGMIDTQVLNDFVIKPLRDADDPTNPHRLLSAEVVTSPTVGKIVDGLLRGRAVLCVEGQAVAWQLDVRGFEHREPSEPDLEPSIRGSREGLVEVLRVNTAAIRRRMATDLLRVEEVELGRLTRTRVALLYIGSRVDPTLVAEAKARLKSAPWDSVVSSQQVEALLEDRTWSLFDQVRHNERPDVCVAALNEGRIVIIVDGTPFALIVPTMFWDLLQAPDDYHLRWPFGSTLRAVRLIGLLLMLGVLPAYVAVTTFHQELISTEFYLSLAAAREGLPLPTIAEALAINFAFDLLREASTRLPKQIAGALTIVGALVVGEAAVRGGFVSAPMIILIGLAALSAFVLPAFSTTVAFRILNYVLLLLAGSLGLFGVAFGLVMVLAHMASLTSMGLPFLAPLAPFRFRSLEDVIVRAPWRYQHGPPAFVGTQPPERTHR